MARGQGSTMGLRRPIALLQPGNEGNLSREQR
jgi:hypothetical protein